MDAALAAERLATEVSVLLEAHDFEGVEELLASSIDANSPTLSAFVHLQYARLYRAWNKLASAIDHLNRAAEIPGADPFLRLQIKSELASTRNARSLQRP